MKVQLSSFDTEASYFHSTIENAEKDSQLLPCRALRKINSQFYGQYINEVLIGVRKSDLPSNADGYEQFDRNIENKINKKAVKDKINIINFFGEKTIDMSDFLSFEDINLLYDFEQRYNDHYVTLPFTLKFRQNDYKATQIFDEISKYFSDFSSTIKTSNLLGYIPAYVSFRNLDNYIKLYSDHSGAIKSPLGQLNFVPLMIDFREKSPDSLKRSLDKLLQLKNQYLKEGYYLFYYGFSPRTPSVSQKLKIEDPLAKDFLLAYLGFDVIGGSYARLQGNSGKPLGEKVVGVFNSDDFKYHSKILPKEEFKFIKPQNFVKQTLFLQDSSKKLQENPDFVINELKKRNDAFKYIQSYKN